VLNRPDSLKYDISDISKKVTKCPKLKSLTISNSTCNYSSVRKKPRLGYFKKLGKLKTIKLYNIKSNDPTLLVRDITWNCRNLDTLAIVNSGVNIFNYPKERSGFLFIQKEKMGPNLKYLEIDGNIPINTLSYYISNSTESFDTLDSPLDTLVPKGTKRTRIRHLVLADNPTLGSWRTERDNRLLTLYYKYLFKVWNEKYSTKSMSLNGGNSSYRSNFYFYKRIVERNALMMNIKDETYSAQDSADNLTYIGKLSTGTDNNTELLPWLISYDRIKKSTINWDTNSIVTRKQSCRYANGFITPIQWNNTDENPKYFSKMKMKSLAQDHQSVVSLKQTTKKEGTRFYKLIFRKDIKGLSAPELEYVKNRYSSGFNGMKNYSFTMNNKRKEKILTTSNILDAWPTFNATDSIYYLVFKTPKRLDSVKINWWSLSGDTLDLDFTRRMRSLKKEQERRERTLMKRSSRAERSISRHRKSHLLDPSIRPGLPRYDLFFKKFNAHRNKVNLPVISRDKWDSIYTNFTKNPWPYYANSLFDVTQLKNALKIYGYSELDQTSWYKQYSAVELFNTSISRSSTYSSIRSVIQMDAQKKTYSIISSNNGFYVNQNGATNLNYIIPKIYNPNITVAALGYGTGFYCTKPYFTYKKDKIPYLVLEEMPLSLINFETFFETLEDKN
jgi:hypothetical protein